MQEERKAEQQELDNDYQFVDEQLEVVEENKEEL